MAKFLSPAIDQALRHDTIIECLELANLVGSAKRSVVATRRYVSSVKHQEGYAYTL